MALLTSHVSIRFGFLFCLFAFSNLAHAIFDETAALHSLAGHWQGKLTTGQGLQAKHEHVDMQLSVAEDGQSILELIERPGQATQGPGVHLMIPRENNEYQYVQIHSKWAWILVTEQQIESDQRPALLRTRLMCQGPEYQIKLELDYLDDRFEHWQVIRKGKFTRTSREQLVRQP